MYNPVKIDMKVFKNAEILIFETSFMNVLQSQNPHLDF